VAHLNQVLERAEAAGVRCEILLGHGDDAYAEIVEEAAVSQMDVIVMGRREKSDLLRSMLGSTTAKVIGYAPCDVLVVPRSADAEGAGKDIVLGVDGSSYSDAAASTAIGLASQCQAAVTVVSVAADARLKADAEANVRRVQEIGRAHV
jgi:nucleotide-binding universal stress UspA family protein